MRQAVGEIGSTVGLEEQAKQLYDSAEIAGGLTFGGVAVVRAAPKILSKTGNVISGIKGLFRKGPKGTPNIPDPTVGDNIEVNLQPKGTVKPNDVVSYRPSNSPLENHHGVMDVWAKHNVPDYVSRGAYTPTVALTKEQHSATKAVYRQWLFEKTGRKVGGKVD